MQEKLIDILSRATAWMTAQQIADAGGWRSASNVTVALQQMEKASGKVEHRKSQTELMANGLPATEWKLTDKKIKDATESKMGRKPKHPPLEPAVVREIQTTEMPSDKECCNAAKVVATTAGAEVSALNARIEAMEEEIGQRNREIKKLTAERDADHQDVLNWERTMEKLVGTDSLKYVVETITGMQGRLTATENSLTEWAGVGSEYECKSPAELRVFIGSLEQRVDLLKMAVESLNEQLMHGTETVDVKNAKGYLVCAPKRKPAKLMKADSAIERAKSAAKATGRSEVFALVPVGAATRKRMNVIVFQELAA